MSSEEGISNSGQLVGRLLKGWRSEMKEREEEKNKLPFIIWTLDRQGLHPRKYWDDELNIQVRQTRKPEKLNIEAALYQNDIFEQHLAIPCVRKTPKETFFDLIHKFSKDVSSKDAWLSVADSRIPLGNSIAISHKNIKLKHFALGNWTGLSTFTQYFNSSIKSPSTVLSKSSSDCTSKKGKAIDIVSTKPSLGQQQQQVFSSKKQSAKQEEKKQRLLDNNNRDSILFPALLNGGDKIDGYKKSHQVVDSAKDFSGKKAGRVNAGYCGTVGRNCNATNNAAFRVTEPEAMFEHADEMLTIYFRDVQDVPQRSVIGQTHWEHKLVISYNSIVRFVVKREDRRSPLEIFIHLVHSPLLYRTVLLREWMSFMTNAGLDYESAEEYSLIIAEEGISRETLAELEVDDLYDWGIDMQAARLIVNYAKSKKKKIVSEISSNNESRNSAKDTVSREELKARWERCVEFGSVEGGTHCDVIGQSRVIKLSIAPCEDNCGKDVAWATLCSIALKTDKPVYFSSVKTVSLPRRQYKLPHIPGASFNLLWAISCLLSIAPMGHDELFLNDSLLKEFPSFLKSLMDESSEALEEGIYELYHAYERFRIISLRTALEALFKKYRDMQQSKVRYVSTVLREPPPNTRYVRKIILTPTKLVLRPPQLVSTNRLLHAFEADYALRVQVRDDTMEALSFTLGVARDIFLRSFVKPKLISPITIANRQYAFLCSSSSQLRDHSCWFYACDSKKRTAESIRHMLGDLSEIKNPAKYMARLGQSFSQSLCFIEVPQECTTVEKDIEGPPNAKSPYCFSDGVGRISLDLMLQVQKALDRLDMPSAIQFRYGGCKGILVLDPTLEGNRIVFRNSQYKYPSDSKTLFILKASEPCGVCLNRPMISILDQKMNGGQRAIKETVFIDLLRKTINKYLDAMFDSNKAAELLQEHSTYCDIPFRQLAEAGLDLREEPFFKTLVRAIYRNCMYYVKEKARIEVPLDGGRNMLGVLDETGTLKYGEVFVQYTVDVAERRVKPTTKVLTGPLIVTKNPCMVLGDIRRLEAVDCPALHHIRDCVVFPQRGERPHPNEMAGSDLDGDEYSVIWYKDLVFQRNDKPMHFPDPVAPPEVAVDREKMVDFFCHYIVSDIVGLVANANLAWSDFLEDGLRSTMCNEIAKKFSHCVDFAKSGRRVFFKTAMRPTIYPEFMGKIHEKPTYVSKRVLGRLYREVTASELGAESMYNVECASPDERLLVEGYQEYMPRARVEFDIFKRRLQVLLMRYGVETEAEVISGAISTCNEIRRHDPTDLSLIIRREIINLMAMARREFYHMIEKDDMDAQKKKAAAYYKVSYERRTEGALAFPFVVADLQLKNLEDANTRLKEREESVPIRESLESAVDSMLMSRFPQNDGDQEEELDKKELIIDAVHQVLVQWCDTNRDALIISNDKKFRHFHDIMRQVAVKEYESMERTFGADRVQKHPSLVFSSCLRQFLNEKLHKEVGGNEMEQDMRFLGNLALEALSSLIMSGEASSLITARLRVDKKITECICMRVTTNEEDNKFFLIIMQFREEFLRMIRQWTFVDHVDMEVNPKDHQLIRFVVTGSPWSIGHTKNIIPQDNFKVVVRNLLSRLERVETAKPKKELYRNDDEMVEKKKKKQQNVDCGAICDNYRNEDGEAQYVGVISHDESPIIVEAATGTLRWAQEGTSIEELRQTTGPLRRNNNKKKYGRFR